MTNGKVHVQAGRIVSTPGALEAFTGEFLADCLRKHLSGDWGMVSHDDARANDSALDHEERIMSVYESAEGQRLWIISEGDRSSTCCLLPSEY
jgi:hypothetical protein